MSELAGTTAAFENRLVVTDCLQDFCCKGVLVSLVNQFAKFLQSIVVGKWILFVERPDLGRHRAILAGGRLVERWDAIDESICLPGRAAAEAVVDDFESGVVRVPWCLKTGED